MFLNSYYYYYYYSEYYWNFRGHVNTAVVTYSVLLLSIAVFSSRLAKQTSWLLVLGKQRW